MVKKLYPKGKAKAFVLTYDDGVEDDRKFVSLLNKYHLKGTFNLNSGLMANGFTWTTDEGYEVKRLPREEVVKLYEGHEVASHSLTHPFLRDWNLQRLFAEISIDKENLSSIFKTTIHGFAIPFDYYDVLVTKCVKDSGFEYMRISEVSHSFDYTKDYYKVVATCFHLEDCMSSLFDDYLKTNQELAVFMIVGHSYDLAVHNMFGKMEEIFKKVSSTNDIASLTMHEYISYLKAMELAIIKDNSILNKSKKTLWFKVNDIVISLKPNESYNF